MNTHSVNTARWRQRRNAAIASTMAAATTGCQVIIMPLIQPTTSVSQGVRTAASCRSGQVLAWSPARSRGARSEIPMTHVTVMAASTSHTAVLSVIRWGSGGGVPVGRRCRLVRCGPGARADRGAVHDAPRHGPASP
jgi:hypothetical protein